MGIEGEEFDLVEIVTKTMSNTRKISAETYDYLYSISRDRLIQRLTSSQAKEIAKELLLKMGLVSSE